MAQESLLEFCNLPNYNEGWCLQFNQHLEKTLLVPVAAEPKVVMQKIMPERPTGAGAAIVTSNVAGPVTGSGNASGASGIDFYFDLIAKVITYP